MLSVSAHRAARHKTETRGTKRDKRAQIVPGTSTRSPGLPELQEGWRTELRGASYRADWSSWTGGCVSVCGSHCARSAASACSARLRSSARAHTHALGRARARCAEATTWKSASVGKRGRNLFYNLILLGKSPETFILKCLKFRFEVCCHQSRFLSVCCVSEFLWWDFFIFIYFLMFGLKHFLRAARADLHTHVSSVHVLNVLFPLPWRAPCCLLHAHTRARTHRSVAWGTCWPAAPVDEHLKPSRCPIWEKVRFVQKRFRYLYLYMLIFMFIFTFTFIFISVASPVQCTWMISAQRISDDFIQCFLNKKLLSPEVVLTEPEWREKEKQWIQSCRTDNQPINQTGSRTKIGWIMTGSTCGSGPDQFVLLLKGLKGQLTQTNHLEVY